MRQLIRFLLTFFIFLICNLNCYSAINGSIEYQIPFDYSKFTKEELEQKAQEYYNLAIVSKSLDSNMTNAIIFYRILCRKYPDNTIYYTKVGILYDILGKDKQAKGSFWEALGNKPQDAEAHFRLGEFYYHRNYLRKALKMYLEAYKFGYNNHYQTVYKIADIYDKFGDTEAALKYFQLANNIQYSSNVDERIERIKDLHKTNREYYIKRG